MSLTDILDLSMIGVMLLSPMWLPMLLYFHDIGRQQEREYEREQRDRERQRLRAEHQRFNTPGQSAIAPHPAYRFTHPFPVAPPPAPPIEIEFAPASEVTILADEPAAAGHCPICSDDLTDRLRVCPQCKTKHHAECWEYNGGCAIYACNYSPAMRRLA